VDTGDVLADRYELLAVVGRGGMGEVFRAHDRHLRRDVAVKVLPRHLVGDRGAEERLRREARTAAALGHPNVVAVHDAVETAEGGQAIVMELVDGPSLAEVLATEGRLDPDRALGIVAGIAEGLAAAHAAGLVHRDVKPSNVLLTADGTPKVADFGIARSVDQTATQTGLVRGSAPYLAPEQARGDPVDARTDVYALGALLFELVTGRPPFTADEPLGIVHQHLHDAPPDPRALAPVGDALAGAMLRALAKDPDQRYPDPRDLVAAARRGDATVVLPPPGELATARMATSGPATEEVGTAAPTDVAATRGPSAGDGPSRRRSLVALAAVAVVGALVAAAALLGTEDPDAPEVVAVSLPPSEPATETSPPPSPDPTPTPSPEPTSPSTVEEAGAAVRRTIEEQRRDGQLSTKAVTELEEQLRKVLEKDAEGEPEAAAKELQKLREILDELVAKREATAVAAETLATPLDDLDALLPDVDESGRGGNDREDDDD
jgi:eukaryotic-like serine/threonine-protein kinase